MTERNGWMKWLVGALWGVIVIAITTIASSVVSNDQNSRLRDTVEACQRELVKGDVIRIDTNQKTVIIKLTDVEIKVNNLITSQAVMTNNQETIIATLKELKQEIKKIQ